MLCDQRLDVADLVEQHANAELDVAQIGERDVRDIYVSVYHVLVGVNRLDGARVQRNELFLVVRVNNLQ